MTATGRSSRSHRLHRSRFRSITSRVLLALLVGLSGPACWVAPISTTPEYAAEHPAPVPGSEVMLRVNDRAIPWGAAGPGFGELLRLELQRETGIALVHYLVVPRDLPELDVDVRLRGRVDENVAVGLLGAAIVGLTLFLAAPVVPFAQTLELDGSVALRQGGREVDRVLVSMRTRVIHGLFAPPSDYQELAIRDAAANLARQIAPRLSRAGTRRVPVE